MNGIMLPQKFEEIIKRNQELHGAIHTSLDLFTKWLYANQLIFFPEYTDHGVNHVQDVLNTAEKIIRNDSFGILNPEDIYVLTSSILLHDCAMHISKAGLKELINKETYSSSLFGYGVESSFKIEWSNFEREVSKYSDSDWHKFFSDESPVAFPDLERDLTEKQLVIIGEFIRKHHARMAQVIARHGLPTGKTPVIFFNTELLHLNELSGFVARSHNISLREAVELIRPENARVTKNTHIAFIMGVLRIADYLQFERKRTPKLCFNVRAFCSPISIQEWKKQIAVLNTHLAHSDEELIYVDAFPEDAVTLEGLGRLIKGLQSELDSLWAVLGEIYSRFNDKKDLGINIRRVRSTIDDPEYYVQKNYRGFHPRLVGLSTNDERLYPLLASPLYGNKPLIGLRELIQNSIDACNERFALEEGKDPINQNVPYGIEITLNKDNKTLIIEDAGSGMDVSIIENYFLKIGSSFRYSASWQDNYLRDSGAIVPRTGRFGVGVLAGFLLGEKITIHTRKVDEPEEKAVSFSITPSSQKIQINYERKETYGTTISIELNDFALSKFQELVEDEETKNENFYIRRRHSSREDYECRWYYLDTPDIKLNLLNDKIDSSTKKKLISKNELHSKWNLLPDTESIRCYWGSKGSSTVYCNGIVIPKTSPPEYSLKSLSSISRSNPYQVFFVDNNAALTLNLQRNGFLDGEFPLAEKLKSELLNVHIRNSLSSLEKFIKKHQKADKRYRNNSPVYRNSGSTFAINKEGICTPLFDGFQFNPNDLYLIDYVKDSVKRGLVHSKSEKVNALKYGYIYVNDVEKQSSETKSALDFFTGSPIRFYDNDEYDKTEDRSSPFHGWHFIKKFDYNKLDNHDLNSLKKKNYICAELNGDWMEVRHESNKTKIPSELMGIFDEDLNCFMFSLVSIKSENKETSDFFEKWNSLNLPNSISENYFNQQ